MADPDTEKPTEIELEFNQRQRLLEVFSLVKTYDAREAVIVFCEELLTNQ